MKEDSGTLLHLLEKGIACAAGPSSTQKARVERLSLLRDRLKTSRFQLAVLGQFKRGKSTVLNALIGEAVLPVGVIPVTAIPTFISFGKCPALELTLLSGERRSVETPDTHVLARELTELVSEQRNPENRKGLARVNVAVNAALLGTGLILVDTPGVGSTHQHNTRAAQAILPECDAALYVLSFDPPITETEVDYLRLVREVAGPLIIVINKADLVETSERETVVSFVREVLETQFGFADPTIFTVSARDALLGKITGNQSLLDNSRVAALEVFLRDSLVAEKESLLYRAVTDKAGSLVSQTRVEIEIQHKALLLPLKTLEEKIAAFEVSLAAIETERQMLADFLAGDRIRMLAFVQAAEDQIARRAHSQLFGQLNDLALKILNPIDLQNELQKFVTGFFDEAFRNDESTISDRLQESLDMHQTRADRLIQRIQELAADLMAIPRGVDIQTDTFRVEREPYWVGPARLDTLSSLFLDTLYSLLPVAIQRKRLGRQLMQSVERAITRNISNFDWAFRQTIEDTLRRCQAAMDQRLADTLKATRGAMQMARERRLSADADTTLEADSLNQKVLELKSIEEELKQLRFAST